MPTRHQCLRTLHLDPLLAETYTPSDLRHAYLRRAKEVHPDKHPNDAEATRTATRAFQEVSRAYAVLSGQEEPSRQENDGDDDANENGCSDMEDIDIERYRRVYETLSQKANVFWETSAEAKVLKMLWRSFRGVVGGGSDRSGESGESGESDGGDGGDASEGSDGSEGSEGSDENGCEGSDGNDGSESDTGSTGSTTPTPVPPPIHISLPLPLTDVYHNVLHKVHYTRYRYVSSTRTTEESTVLLPAACRRLTCFGEGDQQSPEGPMGDVVFDIVPQMPSEDYRIDPDRLVLERTVALTPDEMCYGTGEEGKVVDVCGTSVVVHVEPGMYRRWGRMGGDTVEVGGKGLMEVGGGGEGEGEDGGGEDAGRGVLCVKCVVVGAAHTTPE